MNAFCLTCVLFVPSGLLAEDVASAIEKAVQAAGGEATLAQIKGASWECKGRYHVKELHISARFSTKGIIQAPNQARIETKVRMGKSAMSSLIVTNGTQGWITRTYTNFGDDSTDIDEMDEADLRSLQDDLHCMLLTYNPRTLKNATLHISLNNDVDDRERVALKVVHPHFHDVVLYYDRTSGLLVKRDAFESFGLLPDKRRISTVFNRHKMDSGMRYPAASVSQIDETPFREVEVLRLEVLTKQVPPNVFEKPR